MVEGRYWSYGVGGLWGFKGGWPGRPERSQTVSMGWTHRQVLTARPTQDLSAEAGLSSLCPAALPCLASLSPSSPLWLLLLSTLPPQEPPPSSLLPPISVSPALGPLPDTRPLTLWVRWAYEACPGVGGGSLPNCPTPPPQSAVPGRVGFARVGTSAQATQLRPQKLAEDPALLRRTCQVQLALCV